MDDSTAEQMLVPYFSFWPRWLLWCGEGRVVNGTDVSEEYVASVYPENTEQKILIFTRPCVDQLPLSRQQMTLLSIDSQVI
jgi:hypothetical protein